MQTGKLAERVLAKQQPQPLIADRLRARDILLLLLLLCVHVCCFLPACLKVGFYLDDWLTMWNLHFAPHNFVDLIKASFSDPRMVTRPVQCVYYALTYMFFGDRPLPYHLLRFALEYAGAVALYLGLKRISSSQFIAGITALIFLLYPSHDATHYWIGAGLGAGFGLTLFLVSFAVSTYAYASNKKWLYFAALGSYGLSAFCYEAYLPMLSMTFCAVLLLSSEYRLDSRLNTMRSVILWFLPFVLIGLAEPVYQRLILPRFSPVFLSPAAGFDPVYSLNVFVQGLNVSLFAGFWSFLAQRLRETFLSFNLSWFWQFTGVLLSSLAVVLCSYVPKEKIRYRRLFTAAIVTFFASYLTFALAQGYTPVLDTMINRVNTGASVAVSLVLALSIKWLIEHMQLQGKTARAVCSLVCAGLAGILVLANFSLSSFWICSWRVQKDIRFLISSNADKIKDGDSLILANTHRYLMWAPVFDGTWDFQSMLRMTLNRNSVSGGVVSDRLKMENSAVNDVSAGYLCASYPIKSIKVLFPSKQNWTTVKSGEDFIRLIEDESSAVPVPGHTISRWRDEVSLQKQ